MLKKKDIQFQPCLPDCRWLQHFKDATISIDVTVKLIGSLHRRVVVNTGIETAGYFQPPDTCQVDCHM